MSKKYDTLVLIGRFQPVHNAHVEIIQRAARLCDQLVIIAGSANEPRTYKNPFTSAEREVMLHTVIDQLWDTGVIDNTVKIHIEHNTNSIYNDQAWAVRVQGIVKKYATARCKVGIIGHKKDATSFYLDMFPQWAFENVELIEPLNATDIRDLYFRKHARQGFILSAVPAGVGTMLVDFTASEEYQQIIREREFLIENAKQYAGLKYPPIFVTVDAVVICSGHVLMIKRRAEPGKGLWAMPGGYVNAHTDKTVEDAMLRELREETLIKVPAPVLRGSIVRSRVFDAVDRSPRGRIITHAFHIQLPDGELPKVKGNDDAEKARWVPIAEVQRDKCFEDHYEIIQHFLGA